VIEAFDTLRSGLAVAVACQALGVPRATVYRTRHRRRAIVSRAQPIPRPRPPLALSDAERGTLLTALNSERFADMAPRAIYATLLDEGRYLASVRTMYRVLAAEGQSLERRRQRTHPPYAKPELLAVAPRQVWSWDITKLKGPVRWSVYHLYVILDIFSRYVVGWMVALREAAELAEQFIAETIAKQQIAPGTLTLHADRGTSMRSKPVAALLVDLNVARTHSRPHVSDDNPYSESQFRTLKYRPDFPDRFGSLEDARAHCQRFFHWYNNEHRHSGIGLMTPHAVHHGAAETLQVQRAMVLQQAYEANPLRFKGCMPQPPTLPTAAWINPPKETASARNAEPCTVISVNRVSQND
jgi:putative transposase